MLWTESLCCELLIVSCYVDVIIIENAIMNARTMAVGNEDSINRAFGLVKMCIDLFMQWAASIIF